MHRPSYRHIAICRFSLELTAQKGYYIKYSSGMFTPDEDSIFHLQDLTKKQRSLIRPIFEKNRNELAALDVEIKQQYAAQWVQIQKILSQTQIAETLERSKKKGRSHPVVVDAWHSSGLTQDQLMKLSTIHNSNIKIFVLENRSYAIKSKQGELVEPLLTIPQLAELQHQR